MTREQLFAAQREIQSFCWVVMELFFSSYIMLFAGDVADHKKPGGDFWPKYFSAERQGLKWCQNILFSLYPCKSTYSSDILDGKGKIKFYIISCFKLWHTCRKGKKEVRNSISQVELNVPLDFTWFPSTSLFVEKPPRLCSLSSLLGGGHGVVEDRAVSDHSAYTGQPILYLEMHSWQRAEQGDEKWHFQLKKYLSRMQLEKEPNSLPWVQDGQLVLLYCDPGCPTAFHGWTCSSWCLFISPVSSGHFEFRFSCWDSLQDLDP